MSAAPIRTRSRWIAITIATGLVIAVLLLLRQPQRRVYVDGFFPHCANNLKAITLALHEYHEDQGCFPPPCISDDDGTPLHSWRVLLLPSLGESDLYAQYDFNEPWNGPNNSKLADQMPTVFGCPDQKTLKPHARQWATSTTNYLALVGPTAAFNRDTSRTLADFKDNTRYTIMVTEVIDSNVNWLEPRDKLVADGVFAIAGGPHIKESTGIYVAYADGSVRLLPSDTPTTTLKGLVTINGNEPLPDEL